MQTFLANLCAQRPFLIILCVRWLLQPFWRALSIHFFYWLREINRKFRDSVAEKYREICQSVVWKKSRNSPVGNRKNIEKLFRHSRGNKWNLPIDRMKKPANFANTPLGKIQKFKDCSRGNIARLVKQSQEKSPNSTIGHEKNAILRQSRSRGKISWDTSINCGKKPQNSPHRQREKKLRVFTNWSQEKIAKFANR